MENLPLKKYLFTEKIAIMEKIPLFWIVVLNICTFSSFAQTINPWNCTILGISPEANFSSNMDCFNYNIDFSNAPVINVYINAHITVSEQNESTTELVQRIRFLIDEANKSLENLQPNFGIPVSRTPWIPKAKVKLKLYSDLAVQPNDTFGGIWVYPFRQGLPKTTPATRVSGLWGHQNRYGSNVMDIVFVNYLYNNTNDLPHSLGLASLGGSNNFNVAHVADINRCFFYSNLPGQNNERVLQLSRALNHEVGHMLSLSHVEDCNNECSNAVSNPRPDSDINPNWECGSRCPEKGTCGGFNPKDIVCNDSIPNCLWANSTLMMSQGWWQNSVTPCQWNRIFNYVKNNSVNYFKLCHTDTVYVLPTSPHREYRASQQISSTSTIATGRDVDYFAPSIVLNPGFAVALSTQFLAYPALFTCCDGIITRSNPLVEDNSGNNQNPARLTIAPNPFDNKIQIKYHIETDTDKVKLTMTDVTGRIVKNIPVSHQSKGQHQVEVNTHILPNGIYFIHYQSNGNNFTQKLIKANKN